MKWKWGLAFVGLFAVEAAIGVIVLRAGRLFRYDLVQDMSRAYAAGKDTAAHRMAFAMAVAGNPQAQYFLGLMSEEGRGTSRDESRAWAWYRRACGRGYSMACYHEGFMYEIGRGVPQDYSRAMAGYRKAAAAGLTAAQISVGLMYQKGLGVERDYVEAYRWFAMAEAGRRFPPSVSHLERLKALMPPEQIAAAHKRVEADPSRPIRNISPE